MVGSISRPEVLRRQAALFAAHSAQAAPMLIGWTLTLDGVGGRIVETEAYDLEDPATHSFAGPHRRNAVMFEAGGRDLCLPGAYGIHWWSNLVCGRTPGERQWS